jgi:hypothetical protein
VARTAESPITLVLDPDDDVGCLEQLRCLHSRPYGQVLCEPDPTATIRGIALHLLAALGKHVDAPTHSSPWPLVSCHLQAEHVRDLAVTRAHTLGYGALRRLAESTRAAHSGLWLISVGERPTSAITQLLEACPHEQSTLGSLIDRWRAAETPPEVEPVPLGHGADFPTITPRRQTAPLTRAALTRGMPDAARGKIRNAWDQASIWATAWLESHPEARYQDLADAVYRLAARADSASELLIRALAAVNALRHAGLPIKRDLFEGDMILAWGETRPYQWRDTIARSAHLADRTASADTAALIAVSALYRSPHSAREITVGGVTPDGAITSIWGSCCAVPPQLRQPLATQRQQLTRAGATTRHPLLPGGPWGRMSTQAIENALAILDAPTSMWTDGPDIRDYFNGPAFDGRSILNWLNPLDLFQPDSSCR